MKKWMAYSLVFAIVALPFIFCLMATNNVTAYVVTGYILSMIFLTVSAWCMLYYIITEKWAKREVDE